MNEKHNLATFVLDVVRNLVAPPEAPEKTPTAPVVPEEKKKVSLNELSIEDLEKSRALLDHEERKTLLEIKELEKQKRVLGEQVSTGKVSDTEIKIFARKIKELLDEVAGLNQDLQMLGKQTQVLSGFIRIKKRTDRLKNSPFSVMVGSMDLSELSVLIRDATVEEKLNMEKFDRLIGDLNMGHALTPEMTEDAGTLEIEKVLRKMAEAGQSEALFQELDEVYKNKVNNTEEDLNES